MLNGPACMLPYKDRIKFDVSRAARGVASNASSEIARLAASVCPRARGFPDVAGGRQRRNRLA